MYVLGGGGGGEGEGGKGKRSRECKHTWKLGHRLANLCSQHLEQRLDLRDTSSKLSLISSSITGP